MMFYEIVSGMVDTPVVPSVLSEVGKIGLWLQTLGIIVILYIIFDIISLVFNIKRMKEITKIKEHMKVIENKIDKLATRRK